MPSSPTPDPNPFPETFQLRQLPLADVRIESEQDLGPAGHGYVLTGVLGNHELTFEVLLSRSSSGSWYFTRPKAPPRKWLGRCFAGKA